MAKKTNKARRKPKKKPLDIIVIAHGKSEKTISESIRSHLRIKLKVYSKDNGRCSIQITSVMDHLNNAIFGDRQSFLSEYPDVGFNGNKLSGDFRLFIIMDTDDCNETQKKAFMDGSLFSGHWLSPYIVPIFNINNLEDVLKKAGIDYAKKDSEKGDVYFDVFPKSREAHPKVDFVKDMIIKFRNAPHISNFNLLFEKCLDYHESFK